MILPLSKNLEEEIVLINARIPNTKITSKNAFVRERIERIAIAVMRLTPTTSIAMTRSGKVDQRSTRINVIKIATPNKFNDIHNKLSIIIPSPLLLLFQIYEATLLNHFYIVLCPFHECT